MRGCHELLAAARARYDLDPELAAAARKARCGGFPAGAEWMRRALGGRGPGPVRGAWRLGFAKYGLATLAAAAPVVAGVLLHTPVPLLLAPVLFYLVEARFVFAFPLAIDGAPRPLRASHALVRRCGGVVAVTSCVLRIAAEMLIGGLLGRGFLRSWCVGCLAVVLWYEAARTEPRT